MISIADLVALERDPKPAYPEYEAVREEARRRTRGPIDPADLAAYREVIAAHHHDWCRSVLGRDVPGLILARGSGVSALEVEMLRVAHERGLLPPKPPWLVQWQAESEETRRLQREAREAGERRIAAAWAAALETSGLTVAQLEVRPNLRSQSVRAGVRQQLRHVVPLVDARSKNRRHPAGRELCTVSRPRVLGDPTGDPATCVSCVRYVAEIRPVAAAPTMMTVCEHCRRRVRKQKNIWYHQGSGSIFCDPTGTVDGLATPVQVAADSPEVIG